MEYFSRYSAILFSHYFVRMNHLTIYYKKKKEKTGARNTNNKYLYNVVYEKSNHIVHGVYLWNRNYSPSNEWKRISPAPHPMGGSHALPHAFLAFRNPRNYTYSSGYWYEISLGERKAIAGKINETRTVGIRAESKLSLLTFCVPDYIIFYLLQRKSLLDIFNKFLLLIRAALIANSKTIGISPYLIRPTTS